MAALHKLVEDTVLLEAVASLINKNWQYHRKYGAWLDENIMCSLNFLGQRMGMVPIRPGIKLSEGLADCVAFVYQGIKKVTPMLHVDKLDDEDRIWKHEEISDTANTFRTFGLDITPAEYAEGAKRGFSSPVVFDLTFNSVPARTIVYKPFTKPEKLKKELLLSGALASFGINVLPMEELGHYYGSHSLFSVFSPDLTVEEAIAKGIYCDELEDWVIKSLVRFNLKGSLFVEQEFPHYIESWKERIRRDCKLTGQYDCHELFKSVSAESLVEAIRDLGDLTHADYNGRKNYRTEFRRRLKEYGLIANPEDSEFARWFEEFYIEPMMNVRSVLTHHDFQVANIMAASGKIFDLESACYGAPGEDFAKYLVTKYAQTGNYEGMDARAIIEQNERQVRKYVDTFNETLDSVDSRHGRVRHGRIGDALRVGHIDDEHRFKQMLESMMVHSALTTAMQRMKNFTGNPGQQFQEDISYGCFSIFYSSLDNMEREMFDKDFKDSPFGEFVRRYKAGAQPERLGPHSHQRADHVMGEPHNVGHVHQ